MEFKKVEDVSSLLPVLEQRLPSSANVYNAAKFYPKWTSEMKWYILGDKPETSIILGVITRFDWNQEIIISRDLDTPITEETRKAFLSTEAINWNETYCFAAIDTGISDLVFNIGLRDFGNAIDTHPCYYHVLSIEEAKLLKDEFNFGPGIHVSQIPGDEGTDFIMKTWKYSSPESKEHLEKVLKRNVSSGVFVNGEIVAGVGLNSHGLIGMLYTLEEHRGKGYGQAVMHYMMKNCAKEGFVPCCTVEIRNKVSSAFQDKIGFTRTPWTRDFVVYTKATF